MGVPCARLCAVTHPLATTAGDALNARVQESTSPGACRAVLAGATLADLRTVADLNYLTTDGRRGRASLTRRIMADRWPTVAPCSHSIRATAGAGRTGAYVIGDGVTLAPAGPCPWCGRDHA
jgi:hypothetical protein